MLKRLWLLVSFVWAAMMIGNGLTRQGGPRQLDYVIGLSPFVLGWLLALAVRFVITGSPTPARRIRRS